MIKGATTEKDFKPGKPFDYQFRKPKDKGKWKQDKFFCNYCRKLKVSQKFSKDENGNVFDFCDHCITSNNNIHEWIK